MIGPLPTSVTLACHTATPCAAVRSVKAEISTTADGALRLRYRIEGSIDKLAIPEQVPSRAASELWRHTCFEAFIAGSNSPVYCEFNFSPSTEWAAYGFSRYREGMAPLQCGTATPIGVRHSEDRLELTAPITCMALSALPGRGAIRVALATIVEEKSGRLSYWALAHPANQPDFHHPDSFVLHLQRSDRPARKASPETCS